MATDVLVRTSEPARLHVFRRLRELLASREVVANLTAKEQKVKYKSSLLGVVWSMLDPLLYLVVFYVVFTYFIPNNVPNFSVYLLSGLLGFTLLSTGLQGATASVVDNATLVTKVAFPREILPLSAIGASLVNFFWQLLVLVVFISAFRYPYLGANLLLLPLALGVTLLFLTAVGFATAGLNVQYRDTRYLVELSLIAVFWTTPVVYPVTLVFENIGSPIAHQIYLANPFVTIILSFQRAVYGGTSAVAQTQLPESGIGWYAGRLGWVALASAIVLWFTWRSFFRRSGDFAEEL